MASIASWPTNYLGHGGGCGGATTTTTTKNTSDHHHQGANGVTRSERSSSSCAIFQMPLHYPRYRRAEYEVMPEWKLDFLLAEYGLHVNGDLTYKRNFAIGTFLWSTY